MKAQFERGFRMCEWFCPYLLFPSGQTFILIIAFFSRVADRLNSSIREVPVVKPSRLSDKVSRSSEYMLVPKLILRFKELNFFTESMIKKWKVLGSTSPFRKLQIGDYVEDDGLLQSTDYKTKIRAGKHVSLYHHSFLLTILTYLVMRTAIYHIFCRRR